MAPVSERVELKILTSDSVDELRVLAAHDAMKVWEGALEQLVADHGLVLVDSGYEFRPGIGLRINDGGQTDKELDAENAEQILSILPTLTPADAVDERLWVTLALGPFREYARNRWPLGNTDARRHLDNHVFATTDRKRERDHAIARLWWSGHYVQRFASSSLNLSLQALFANSDLSVQLLGRPNLASVEPIARATLKILERHFLDDEVKYNRSGVRRFFEGVDFLAGRRALGILDDEEVLSLLEPSFREHLGIQAVNSAR